MVMMKTAGVRSLTAVVALLDPPPLRGVRTTKSPMLQTVYEHRKKFRHNSCDTNLSRPVSGTTA